jgi:hypothetical protein
MRLKLELPKPNFIDLASEENAAAQGLNEPSLQRSPN